MDNVAFKYQLSQLIKGIDPKEQYQLLESVQRYCEELKRNVAEKVNVQYAEVVMDEING